MLIPQFWGSPFTVAVKFASVRYRTEAEPCRKGGCQSRQGERASMIPLDRRLAILYGKFVNAAYAMYSARTRH